MATIRVRTGTRGVTYVIARNVGVRLEVLRAGISERAPLSLAVGVLAFRQLRL